MTNFNIMNKALKVAWIPRLQTRTDASWKIILEAMLGNLRGLSFLTHCNYDFNCLQINHLPDFYREVLKYWQKHKTRLSKGHFSLKRNNLEQLQLKKTGLKKNIVHVEDLLYNDGKFLFLINFPKNFSLKRLSLFILD